MPGLGPGALLGRWFALFLERRRLNSTGTNINVKKNKNMWTNYAMREFRSDNNFLMLWQTNVRRSDRHKEMNTYLTEKMKSRSDSDILLKWADICINAYYLSKALGCLIDIAAIKTIKKRISSCP